MMSSHNFAHLLIFFFLFCAGLIFKQQQEGNGPCVNDYSEFGLWLSAATGIFRFLIILIFVCLLFVCLFVCYLFVWLID